LLHFEPVTCKQPCRSVLNPFWYGPILFSWQYAPFFANLTPKPSRCPRKSLDLPFLSVQEPTAASLQRHHCKRYPPRASSSQHYDRIPPVSTSSRATNLSICCGHVSGGRQPCLLEGIARDESELAPRECSCWSHHLWHNGTARLHRFTHACFAHNSIGTRPRDRLRGMRQVLCLPRQQGVRRKASPGDARLVDLWCTTRHAIPAWSTIPRRPSISLPSACPTG
jgi:hypothetical protein